MEANHQLFMISLKVLLKNEKGEYLLLKSPSENPLWKGKYDLPGGRINDDEVDVSFHELIDREIKEEAGEELNYKLRKDPVGLIKYRLGDGRCVLYVLFEALYLSGPVVFSEEHCGYLWQTVTAENADQFFHPKFAELFRTYLDWNKNVSVKF